jgi:hypothetical protein
MRTLLLSACLAASTATLANECNIEIEGHIELDESVIIVETEDGDHVRFTNNELWVNKQSIALTSEQQSYVNDYFNGIQQSVPLTFDIAMDAIDIAGSGVTAAFGGLLGEDDELVDELNESFSTFKEKLQDSFYNTHGRMHFSSSSVGGNTFFNGGFDEELSEEIESLVSRSVGRLMIAVGTQMLFGNDDGGAFEQRMEDFGHELEQQMELKAEHIEDKANELCDTLLAVESSENKLRYSIPELENFNMLSVDKEGYKQM